MPIRFRCSYCSRLLGIARRKSGSQIRCPQCSNAITVPIQDDGGDLQELDDLLNAAPRANGQAAESGGLIAQYSAPAAAQAVDLPEPESARPVAPQPPAAKLGPAAAPSRTKPSRKATEEEPLLIEDVDDLLGIEPQRLDLDEEPAAKPRPVSGMDAQSLDPHPGKIVLSPRRATLLMIGVVVLIGLAFTAGFLIGSRL